MIDLDIGVEALSPQLTGIGRYTLELFLGLRATTSVRSLHATRNGLRVRVPEQLLDGTYSTRRNRKDRVLNAFDAVRDHVRSAKRLYHGPNFMIPERLETGIVTVHDLSVFKFPETHPPERIAHFEKHLPRSLERALHIITDTETGKRELIEYMGIAEDRITAVPLGVSARFGQESASAEGAVSGVPEYILIVATFEPRKRIEAAVQAHARLPAAVKKRYPLVLVGAAGWKNSDLHEAIEREQKQGFAHVLGFVPEADLPALYRGARLFLFPSIYEGFGLPPIEAMASGVPTIVSNQSCLPEVTQGAAMLIDPNDVEGFSQAILRGLEDEPWRISAIERGKAVANGYTWHACVEETVKIYERFAV